MSYSETRREAARRLSDRFRFRWMLHRDLPAVLAIERASFEFPWDEADFVRTLRHWSRIGLVCEGEGGAIAGYTVYWLHRRRIELLSFAVAPRLRRQGVGTAMAWELLRKLSRERRTRITAEVRETNLPAQQFFRALGFRAVEVRRGAYEYTAEDAYVMEWAL